MTYQNQRTEAQLNSNGCPVNPVASPQSGTGRRKVVAILLGSVLVVGFLFLVIAVGGFLYYYSHRNRELADYAPPTIGTYQRTTSEAANKTKPDGAIGNWVVFYERDSDHSVVQVYLTAFPSPQQAEANAELLIKRMQESVLRPINVQRSPLMRDGKLIAEMVTFTEDMGNNEVNEIAIWNCGSTVFNATGEVGKTAEIARGLRY